MPDQWRDLTDDDALDEAKRATAAIIYKHSPICPTSWSSKREVEKFTKQNPDFPVFVVNVVQDKAFARKLAEDLDVQHESPQVILMQSGIAQKHTSHNTITAQLLESWVNETPD